MVNKTWRWYARPRREHVQPTVRGPCGSRFVLFPGPWVVLRGVLDPSRPSDFLNTSEAQNPHDDTIRRTREMFNCLLNGRPAHLSAC